MHLNTKLISWLVLVLIVVSALYSMFFKSSTPESATSSTQVVGSDLLDLLNKLQTVNFNTDLFTQKDFIKLTDFALPLPVPSLGRPNLFDKIGVDIGPVTSAPVQTIQPKVGTTSSAQ